MATYVRSPSSKPTTASDSTDCNLQAKWWILVVEKFIGFADEEQAQQATSLREVTTLTTANATNSGKPVHLFATTEEPQSAITM
jgi:hypothetical protein